MSVDQHTATTANAHSDSVRWNTDEVFRLIDIVRECAPIYNPLDKNYFCRPYVENLWRDIDIRFGKRPGASLAKWTNLRISFRREYQLLIKKKAKPSWVYFEKMLFLQPFLRKKRQQNEKLESHIQEALQQISSITRGNIKNYVARVEQCNTDQSEQLEIDDATIDDDIEWNDAPVKEETVYNASADYETDHATEEVIDDIDDGPGQYDAEQAQSDDSTVASIDMRMKSKRKFPTTESYQTFLSKRSREDSTSTSVHLNRGENPTSPTETSTLEHAPTNIGCECKTNADAMFLMSLLPDIKMLSRKDKGKFKIDVQRLIQNFLYPDDD